MDLTPPTSNLGIALAGLDITAPLRERLEWAAGAGFRAVALNAAEPGVRPRELNRSARRALAALLRRLELTLAGVDLWIPPAHFSEPAHVERAAEAARGAAEFAADIAALAGAPGGGRAVLSLTLPSEGADAALTDICAAAHRCNTVIADHTWPPADAPEDPADPRRVGLDPAAAILAGEDPAACCARLGTRLAVARLADIDAAGRVPPGRGRLDLDAYLAAVAIGPAPAPLLDLRGVRNSADAASDTLHRIAAR